MGIPGLLSFVIQKSFLWIGAQFPQEKFLSYGRILTLHYYFLLICILISISELLSRPSMISSRRFIGLLNRHFLEAFLVFMFLSSISEFIKVQSEDQSRVNQPWILEELYLMVHTFIIQILGFQELLSSSYWLQHLWVMSYLLDK